MSKVQMLRALVEQRLTAAAQEIFGLFERTIAEYEEELCRSKEENERQRKLLEAVFNPQLRLHRADAQKRIVAEDEEQQERSPSLDQEDPPEPPHVKEEQEELWSSQEGEQLPGLEEADITKFTVTPVPMKSEEDDGEKPPSSQLHQRQPEHMEADGEDCGGPGPARTSDPELQPDTEDKSEDSSGTAVSDWMETKDPQSGLNSMKNIVIPVCDLRCSTNEKLFLCSDCGKTFRRKTSLKSHMRRHTGEKPFTCPVCGKSFAFERYVGQHMAVHTGEKRYICNVCGKRFTWQSQLKIHQCFNESSQLHKNRTKKQITVEKTYICPECSRGFGRKHNLKVHMRTHTGETPFSCPVCSKRFAFERYLTQHMMVHTGEKRYSCSVCDERFTWHHQVKRHKCVVESSQLHENNGEMKRSGADGANCGGPEPGFLHFTQTMTQG